MFLSQVMNARPFLSEYCKPVIDNKNILRCGKYYDRNLALYIINHRPDTLFPLDNCIYDWTELQEMLATTPYLTLKIENTDLEKQILVELIEQSNFQPNILHPSPTK